MTKYMIINVPYSDESLVGSRYFTSPYDKAKVIWRRTSCLSTLVTEANGELGDDVLENTYALSKKLNTIPYLYIFKFYGNQKDLKAWLEAHSKHNQTIIDTGKRTLIQYLKEEYMN